MRTFRVVRGRPALISIGEAASTYPPTGVGDADDEEVAGVLEAAEAAAARAGVAEGDADDGAGGVDRDGAGGGDGDRDDADEDRDGDDDDGFFCFFAMITPERAIGSVYAA